MSYPPARLDMPIEQFTAQMSSRLDQDIDTLAAQGNQQNLEAYLWPPEPPPEDGETLMDLLHRELGAYLISG